MYATSTDVFSSAGGDEGETLLRNVLEHEGMTADEVESADEAAIICLSTASKAYDLMDRALTESAVIRGRCLDGVGASAEVKPYIKGVDANFWYKENEGRTISTHADVPSLSTTQLDCNELPSKEKNVGKDEEDDLRRESAGNMNRDPPFQLSNARLATSMESIAQTKGLKHFSVKVAEKVEGLRNTNYNQVADDLVAEMSADAKAGLLDGNFDEKNVRRRVYDALNVLEALSIIDKDKKDIKWRGWPGDIAESPKEKLMMELEKLAARLDFKARNLETIASKALCLSNLIIRNKDAPMPVLLRAQEKGLDAPNPLALPFMLVHAPANAEIDVNISSDQRSAELDFQHWPFQIFDDETVMKLMGLCERHSGPDEVLGRYLNQNE